MFTGIISVLAPIVEVKKNTGGLQLKVAKPKNWKVKTGESISVNGVCSTLKQDKQGLLFEYMQETLAKTGILKMKKGQVVNLEQSMHVSARFDGHIVQGHVDTAGKIVSISKEGNAFVFKIKPLDGKILKYIVPKGSIAIDGISLTVTAVKNDFSVKIITYTFAHTNLKYKKAGDLVNIECDILAKYIEKILLSRKK